MPLYRVPIIDKWEWQKSVLDKDLTVPPVSPNKSNRYLIYGIGSGAWAGQQGNIAEYDGVTWTFIVKSEGMVLYVSDEKKWYAYTTSWIEFPIQTSKVKAYQSSTQSISANVYVKVNLQSEIYDLLNEFNTGNSRFVAAKAGWYQVNGSVFANVGQATGGYCYIYVNGVMKAANYTYGGAGSPNPTVSDLLYLNSGDYVELYCRFTRNCTLYALDVQTYLSISGA